MTVSQAAQIGKTIGRSHRRRKLLLLFVKSRTSEAGLIIIAAIIVMIAIGPFVIRVSPYQVSSLVNHAPTLQHPFGTDYRGRDVFSQVVWGARQSLFVSVLAGLGAVALGTLVGIFAGYFSKLDGFLLGVSDTVMAFPILPFLILLGLLFRPTDLFIASLLILVLWPPVTRSIRAQVSSIKSRPYVDASRLSGLGDVRIVTKIVLPDILPISMAYLVLNISISIVLVTALEFIGVGNVDIVTWGSILYWAQQFAFYAHDWWWVLAPGLIISLFTIGLALIGFAVEEIVNPRLRAP